MKEKSLMGAKAVVLRLFPYKESSIPVRRSPEGEDGRLACLIHGPKTSSWGQHATAGSSLGVFCGPKARQKYTPSRRSGTILTRTSGHSCAVSVPLNSFRTDSRLFMTRPSSKRRSAKKYSRKRIAVAPGVPCRVIRPVLLGTISRIGGPTLWTTTTRAPEVRRINIG